MREQGKTKEQLTRELAGLSRRVADLERSELERRRIIETADEGIWVFDEQYVTTFANRRMADMLGYSQEEMLGRTMSSFLYEDDRADFEQKAERRRQGFADRYERRFLREDGGTLWAMVSATPMMAEDGSFQGSFAMFTDISERKEAEQALSESEAKYRSIFENAVEGMFQSTPEGRLITANPAMARIFGYASPEEMIPGVNSIGQQLYVNEEDRRAFEQLLEQRGTAGGFEAQFRRKDGQALWGSLNVRAVKDGNGNVLCYEGTLEDITARKTAEEALKRSEEKYRAIFENAVMGIYQVTPDGRYLSANPAVAHIHGYDSPEQMIESVTDIAHQLYVDPSRRAQLRRIMEQEGFVKGFEIILRRKDGSLHWVSNTARAIRDAAGKIRYYEGIVEDITARKVAEEELRQLKRTLQGTLRTLSSAVETREPAIAGHHKRVADLAHAIAGIMGLSEEAVQNVATAATVHDVGKITVPVEILSKPGRLTELEYSFVKAHPRHGYEMLKDAELPYPIAEIVLQHHERINGSGYPQGLKGGEILLEARIVAVADVIEAMVSTRPYRKAQGTDAALREIDRQGGVLYDLDVVDACLRLFRKNRFQFA